MESEDNQPPRKVVFEYADIIFVCFDWRVLSLDEESYILTGKKFGITSFRFPQRYKEKLNKLKLSAVLKDRISFFLNELFLYFNSYKQEKMCINCLFASPTVQNSTTLSMNPYFIKLNLILTFIFNASFLKLLARLER